MVVVPQWELLLFNAGAGAANRLIACHSGILETGNVLKNEKCQTS
jgi:hypothetical protein